MFSNAPPTPKDLAREEQLHGYVLHLADRQPWLVPCARRWHPTEDDAGPACVVALPKGLAYLDGRWVTGHVVDRYRPLWGLVESYCEAMRQACAAASDAPKTNIMFQFDQLDLLAVGALQLNYRVADVELAMLGAYDEKSRQAIVDTVLDNPGFEALTLKKKRCSSTGPAAGNG